MLAKVVMGRGSVGAGMGAGMAGSSGTGTVCNCAEPLWVGSKTASVPCGMPLTTPVPFMLTSTRPSDPTSTPCGAEGSSTL